MTPIFHFFDVPELPPTWPPGEVEQGWKKVPRGAPEGGPGERERGERGGEREREGKEKLYITTPDQPLHGGITGRVVGVIGVVGVVGW